MNYKQLTEGDRYTIAAYKKQGLSLAEIARLTGRHKKLLAIAVLTTVPIGLSKPTNALGQDAANPGVISASLSNNMIKLCTLLKRIGAQLKWSEE